MVRPGIGHCETPVCSVCGRSIGRISGHRSDYSFHRKRVTTDNLGINVHCLEGAKVEGVPVRQAVGAAMV